MRLSDDRTQADVIVPDFQLSLAIGKEGQNARLASRLVGVRIDIKSETQFQNELNGIFEEGFAAGEWKVNPDTGEQEWHAADGSVMSLQEYERMANQPAAESGEANA